MIKLKRILPETDAESVFQNVAFGQKTSYNQDADRIAKLQGKVFGEKDTKTEAEIGKILQGWFQTGMNPQSAAKLYKHFELFKDAKNAYPKIFKPATTNGTVLYRGLSMMPQSLKDFFKKGTTSKKDWKKEKIGKRTYMVCSNPIEYQPENPIQSWTDHKPVALKFGKSAILMTKQTDEFLFNHKFVSLMSGINEREILHFGKTYSKPVTIAVEEGSYYYYADMYSKE